MTAAAATGRRPAATEDRRSWLRLFLLLPPVLFALGGYLVGQRLRQPERIVVTDGTEAGDVFAPARIVPLGRLALPIDMGREALTLTAMVDVAMPSDDSAYLTRRGAGRAQIKDAVILALADAVLVPGIRDGFRDQERLADLVARGLQASRPEVAGLRLSELKLVNAHGAPVDLSLLLPGS